MLSVENSHHYYRQPRKLDNLLSMLLVVGSCHFNSIKNCKSIKKICSQILWVYGTLRLLIQKDSNFAVISSSFTEAQEVRTHGTTRTERYKCTIQRVRQFCSAFIDIVSIARKSLFSINCNRTAQVTTVFSTFLIV